MAKQSKVTEGWSGPGRRDGRIEPLQPGDDGLHITPGEKNMYEWWYFDAHLDSGHTLVVFFYASNPNPGLAGKMGIEIVLLKSDGKRVQKFFPHRKSDFFAARDRPEVKMGRNTLRVEQQEHGLPIYLIEIHEQGLGCNLTYRAEVNGWKPGTGLSHFGEMGYFGWVIPFARAAVEGTITIEGEKISVSGIGYHDHNWLNFQFQRIIDYWMWGRIYSENFTLAYAYIQCNAKVNDHTVKVLMLAEGREVILSTGEFEFSQDDFLYNEKAKYEFPQTIIIHEPDTVNARLNLNRILEAQDMLENFSPVLRTLAKYALRIKAGYFRLRSDFELEVRREGKTSTESGSTLHEIVLFKAIQGKST